MAKKRAVAVLEDTSIPDVEVVGTDDDLPETVDEPVQTEPVLSVSPEKRRVQPTILLLAAAFLVAVIGAGSSVYFYLQYQTAQAVLGAATHSQTEVTRVIENVGKLMVLPSNETPTLATVSDISKLKGQSFFKYAQNGDQVLIYPKNQEAILYRPSINKILQVAPVNLTATQTAPVASTTAQLMPVRVALLNGTMITGLTGRAEGYVHIALPKASVVEKDNAVKHTYASTVVVDVAGTDAMQAAQLAKAMHGTVGPLPSGEIKPVGVDLVVILGNDFGK